MKKINAETASLIASAIVSGENAVVEAEVATVGEVADTETSTEVVEGDLIGVVLDIQDHHHPVGATLETVVLSETPYHDLIHMCQVVGDEIIEEGLQVQNQSRQWLLGPCRTLVRHLAGGIDRFPGHVPHLADGDPDLLTDVAPIEGEGEVQVAELDGDRLNRQMNPYPAPHVRLGGEDRLLLLLALHLLRNRVGFIGMILAPSQDQDRLQGHRAAAHVG